MRCAVCWYLLSGRVYTTATMIVNGQSVCDKHADVAHLSHSVEDLIDRIAESQEGKKPEDEGFGDFASRLP